MTPQYVLRKSLCRPAYCYDGADRIRRVKSEIENMGYANDYAEPGYETPERGILFANWNLFCTEAVTLCERMGFAIEWSDEWSTCGDCGRAVRTSPDSYAWELSFVLDEGELLCEECAEDQP
jgi:hypothetical protein